MSNAGLADAFFANQTCFCARPLVFDTSMLDADIIEEENERRFKESLQLIENVTHEQLVELMGEEFLEEFRRVSQR